MAQAGDLRGPSSCPCTVPAGLPPPRGGGSRGKAGLNQGQTAAALAPSNYSVAQCHAWLRLQRCRGAAGSSLINAQLRGCSQGTPANPALPPCHCPRPGRETLEPSCRTAVSRHVEPVPRKGLQLLGEPPRSIKPQQLIHAGRHRGLTPHGSPCGAAASIPPGASRASRPTTSTRVCLCGVC